jgi:dihydroneopterin aldolase/2-amino-4-hydroxy-6-hydroxymethyldihydropteridine diphosphokinase/dihydropteroate synthase
MKHALFGPWLNFVCLCSIACNLYHPVLYRSIGKLLNLLNHTKRDTKDERVNSVHPVMQIRNTIFRWGSQTYLMGILNVTPDSFSDGNQYFCVESAVERALEMVREGSDIIDIGGMSTRPGSDEIDEEEELSRVIPVIKRIRQLDLNIPISIDTFRSRVAREAIEAGADMINDISGGQRDDNMLSTMADLNVPVCLMHMRGDSKTMNSLANYSLDLLGDIRCEINRILKMAMQSGISRWNIILDPGIGFAKNHEQNLEILKNLGKLTKPFQSPDYSLSSLSILESSQFPWLVGSSRKGFIGACIGEKDASKRDWGTASTICSSVQGGANIVRVHNVKGMKDVLSMADHLFLLSN